ncbi:MAG: sugar ABC transporter permease [Alphaproteobacteria bacterium]|nr:sugar ABC transporter permease [Alphaproteobacteria bacterium]
MRRPRLLRHAAAALALSPATLIVLVVYVGCAIWSIRISMTASRILPSDRFVGLRQYETLLANTRWEVSVVNLAVFGGLFVLLALALGFLLAILIDEKVRGENLFRSLFLYPFSMSFIVTGLVWQWLLNPSLGIQKLGRDLGFPDFRFDWIVDQQMVIFTVVIAAVWHGAGLVMAIALAGLRGIDAEIWKAIRVDGIPTWRAYVSVILPMLGGSLATATVLLAISVVRLYDLVVAMTNGGPGLASEVPAKFVIDHLFDRQNIGLATAATTVMLITVLAVVAPWLYAQQRGRTA